MKKGLLSIFIVLSIVVTISIISYISLVSRVSEKLKISEPKDYALSLAKSNIELINKIGDEISIDSLQPDKKVKGKFQLKLDANGFDFGQNSADLIIPIIGNKTKGRLYVIAYKKNNQWIYETIKAEIDEDNTVINLIESQTLN